MIPQLNSPDVTYFKVTCFDTETCSLQEGLLTVSYFRAINGWQHSTGVMVADQPYAHYSAFHAETIPVDPNAFAVHGISLDKAQALGLPTGIIKIDLLSMVREAHILIGFNISFDNKIIKPFLHEEAFSTVEAKSWCVMQNTKDLVKATNKLGRLKNPNLKEAYQHFIGRSFADMHTSSADAFATMQIHNKALENQEYARKFVNFIKAQILRVDS